MAQTVDELVVKIRADMSQLKRQLDDIEKKTGTIGRRGSQNLNTLGASAVGAGAATGRLTNVLGGLAVVFGTLAGARGIAAVGAQFEDLKDSLDTVFGSIEAGDQALERIFEFAQTTPFQIEDATKAFIGLKSAGIEPTNAMLQTFADTASVSIDQLGTFQALIRVVQRSAGGGLGLEELNMIADRGIDVFKGLNDELGISRLEVADFGKTTEGAQLIVEALITSLNKQFGGAMASKMDNLSTKTSNMVIAFKQLGDEIFKGGLGDFLKGMADDLTTLANTISVMLASFRGEGLGVVLTAPEFKADMSFEEMQAERARSAEENIRIIDEQTKAIEDQIKAQQQLEQRSSLEIAFAGGGVGSNIVQQTADIEAQNKVLENLAEARKKEVQALEDSKKSKVEVDEIEKETLIRQGQLMRGYDFIADAIAKEIGNTDQLAYVKENLTEIYENNKDALLELGYTQEDVNKLLERLANEGGDSANAFSDSLQDAVQSASYSFTNDLINALSEGQKGLDAFKDFADNIAKQIINIFLQMGVINPILNQIFGLKGDAAFTTIFGKRAGGGTVQGRQPVIVGERGPELFIPNTGGTVMNNMNTKNALGSGQTVVVNQSVNFATGVQATVRNEVLQLMPQIADATKAAVAQQSSRGGRYRGALTGA